MTYITRIIGIRLLRFLIVLVKLFGPSEKKPKPVRSITIPSHPQTATNASANVKTKNRHAKRAVRCDIYLPQRALDDARLPVVVNLHGSGFTIHAMGDDARFCQEVADSVPCIVVDTDYSKGPEQPYPAANEDIDAVLQWLLQEGNNVSANVISHKDAFKAPGSSTSFEPALDRLALTGFSAGGNLALTACVRRGKKDKETNTASPFAAIVAFYPSTNLSESPYKKPNVKPGKGASGGVIPPRIRSFFYNCYLPAHDSRVPARDSPLISPLYADADVFPKSVTLITCSGDSLEREGRQMAERIVAGRASSERRAEYAQQDARDKTAKSDPPADVRDVDRIALPLNVEREGVLWWRAPDQGHAWDKMLKPDSEPDRLRKEAYALSIKRLQQAFGL